MSYSTDVTVGYGVEVDEPDDDEAWEDLQYQGPFWPVEAGDSRGGCGRFFVLISESTTNVKTLKGEGEYVVDVSAALLSSWDMADRRSWSALLKDDLQRLSLKVIGEEGWFVLSSTN